MSTDDPNGRDVWAELRSQRDILIRMETMLSSLTDTKNDHETRLRKLEERKFPLPTVAVLIAMASLVATVVMYVTHS